MCLAIPMKINSIENLMATVEAGGVRRTADISLLEKAKVGDYVVVHAGFAIHLLNEQEALATLNLYRQISENG